MDDLKQSISKGWEGLPPPTAAELLDEPGLSESEARSRVGMDDEWLVGLFLGKRFDEVDCQALLDTRGDVPQHYMGEYAGMYYAGSLLLCAVDLLNANAAEREMGRLVRELISTQDIDSIATWSGPQMLAVSSVYMEVARWIEAQPSAPWAESARLLADRSTIIKELASRDIPGA